MENKDSRENEENRETSAVPCPPEIKREIKAAAALQQKTLAEFMSHIWETYKKTQEPQKT